MQGELLAADEGLDVADQFGIQNADGAPGAGKVGEVGDVGPLDINDNEKILQRAAATHVDIGEEVIGPRSRSPAASAHSAKHPATHRPISLFRAPGRGSSKP